MSYFMEMLGVIIGLIFVWLLLSIAVEQVQEWIVGWLSLRADTLEDAIWDMLNDEPKTRKGPWGRLREQFQKFIQRRRSSSPQPRPKIVQDLYNHPLIKSAAQDNSKPAYIQPDAFAKALFSIVMTAGTDESIIKNALGELEETVNAIEPETIEAFITKMIELAKDDTKDQDLEQSIKTFRNKYLYYIKKFDAIQEDFEATKNALKKLNSNKECDRVIGDIDKLNQKITEIKDMAGDTLQLNISSFEVDYPNLINAMLKKELPENPDTMLAMIQKGATKLVIKNSKLALFLHETIKDAKATAIGGRTVWHWQEQVSRIGSITQWIAPMGGTNVIDNGVLL